jgi:hypothetical protein
MSDQMVYIILGVCFCTYIVSIVAPLLWPKPCNKQDKTVFTHRNIRKW